MISNKANDSGMASKPKITNKKKIFNDPVYGFVSVPYGIIFDLLEHPYFQRLRRIKQTSLTHYVYPGALHTRFHHALGALHLMTQAIEVLRQKGTEISEEEAKAVSIAILLHDIGHGPFSHTLENSLMNVSHETISALFMEKLNEEFGGELSLAIQIFNNEYPRHFLHQLVSGQLDMDRLDYLNRDSFFTGVHEGVVSYGRIIKMLAVHQNELVVEQKGIYSIEKFLIARRLMYWQVYLHKTVLSAEQMLILAMNRAKNLVITNFPIKIPINLSFFLENNFSPEDFKTRKTELLGHFASLDDFDIIYALKVWMNCEDPVLAYLSQCIINRNLFRLELRNEPIVEEYRTYVKGRLQEWGKFDDADLSYVMKEGKESNNAYSTAKKEIHILFRDGQVLPMSKCSDHEWRSKIVTKYYLCYPKVF